MTTKPNQHVVQDLEQIGALNPDKAADLYEQWRLSNPNQKVELEQHISILGDIAEWSKE